MALRTRLSELCPNFIGEVREKGKSVYFDGRFRGKRNVVVYPKEAFLQTFGADCLRSLATTEGTLLAICSAIKVDNTTPGTRFLLLQSLDGLSDSRWAVFAQYDSKEQVFDDDLLKIQEVMDQCFSATSPTTSVISSTTSSSSTTPENLFLPPSTTTSQQQQQQQQEEELFIPCASQQQRIPNVNEESVVQRVAINSWNNLTQSDTFENYPRELFINQIVQTVTIRINNGINETRESLVLACTKAFYPINSEHENDVCREAWMKFVCCFILKYPSNEMEWPEIDWKGASVILSPIPPERPWFFPQIKTDVNAENPLSNVTTPQFLMRYSPTLWRFGCFVYSRNAANGSGIVS